MVQNVSQRISGWVYFIGSKIEIFLRIPISKETPHQSKSINWNILRALIAKKVPFKRKKNIKTHPFAFIWNGKSLFLSKINKIKNQPLNNKTMMKSVHLPDSKSFLLIYNFITINVTFNILQAINKFLKSQLFSRGHAVTNIV